MTRNPKLQWCSCGYHFKPTLWMKIVMLVHGEYVKTCPRCQNRLHLHLYHFVVCKKREQVRTDEIYKKG